MHDAPADVLTAKFGWSAGVGRSEAGQLEASATGEAGIASDDELHLPAALLERLVAFGRAASPNECCGVGIGPAGEVREFHPVPNVHDTPVTRYRIDSGDQLRLYLRAEDAGWETTLVFHTHPATEPYPSATDLELAAWPGAVYAILGLGEVAPKLRAYRIVDGQVRELRCTQPPVVPGA